jgi:hypothetical protein
MATKEFWELSTVSDDQLLQDLNGLLTGGARVEARIVAHLAEVEERRLHLKAATSSLFDYCLRRVGLSESEAFHRITAARLARRFPVIFALLEARSIHLSALRVLRDHLTPENHRELLALASGKSKREVELLVATRAPRPDVPSRIRKLPEPRRSALPADGVSGAAAEQATSRLTQSSPNMPTISTGGTISGSICGTPNADNTAPVIAEASPGRSEHIAPTVGSPPTEAPPYASREHADEPARSPRRSAERGALEPLSSARYLLRVSISAEQKNKFERARDLMSHANPSGDVSMVLDKALELLLEKLEKQRFARTSRPRSLRKAPQNRPRQGPLTGANDRPWTPAIHEAPATARQHISNEIHREVALRDGDQCTYVDERGRRCASRAFLQMHHDHAHALGGPSTLENLRLLCGPHNRLLAEKDFGRAHQEHFTGRAASEVVRESR